MGPDMLVCAVPESGYETVGRGYVLICLKGYGVDMIMLTEDILSSRAVWLFMLANGA